MENLTLDEVIEKLQEAKKIYGNIPVLLDINDGHIYEAQGIVFDCNNVFIYCNYL